MWAYSAEFGARPEVGVLGGGGVWGGGWCNGGGSRGASTFRNYCYPSVLYCSMTLRLYDRYMLFAKLEKSLKPVKELLFSSSSNS